MLMSKLYYIYAPMNSAKSTTLLTKAHSFEERMIPFLCLKSTIDDRDGQDLIKSRIGLERECISIEPTDNIYDIIKNYNNDAFLHGIDKLKWILVDECQFLKAEQVDQLSDIVDEFDINVMCFGLRTDFRTRLFEGSMRLMELADNIDEIKTSCGCGRKSIINARIDANGRITKDGQQIVIGGNELYVPLCRKCYKEAISKQDV